MSMICCHLQANMEKTEHVLGFDSVHLGVIVEVLRPFVGTPVIPFSETFIFHSNLNTQKALESP